VLEIGVLNRIFGTNVEEIIRGSGKLHNDELHNFSPNIIRMIKSRTIR
jgi:hypothetical protein